MNRGRLVLVFFQSCFGSNLFSFWWEAVHNKVTQLAYVPKLFKVLKLKVDCK